MKDHSLFKRNSILIGIALSVVGLGFVDYVTGYELDFFVPLRIDCNGCVEGKPYRFVLGFDSELNCLVLFRYFISPI